MLLLGAFGGAPACAGGGPDRAARAQAHENELAALRQQAEQWGEELLTQIPRALIGEERTPARGTRLSNELGGPSREYAVWSRHLDVTPEGELTAREVAARLAPWLEAEGWQRLRPGAGPSDPGRQRAEYARERYHLVVEARSEPRPAPETLALLIVTPETRTLREDPLR